MKPGDLLKFIHVVDLMDPIYRESGWKFGIYLEHKNIKFRGETIKVIESDGKINHYPQDAYHFQVVE